MKLYQVFIEGDSLVYKNGDPCDLGFVKAEYILSNSQSRAESRSIIKVLRKLQRRNLSVAWDSSIEVTEVSETSRYWKIIFDDGFVFFEKNPRSDL